MSVFHNTDRTRRSLRPTTDADGRLPARQSILVIAGLSALSWAVLIALFTALWAII